jgi:hypothetical protein
MTIPSTILNYTTATRLKNNETAKLYFNPSLLSTNVKVKIYNTIILPVVYMGVKLGL